MNISRTDYHGDLLGRGMDEGGRDHFDKDFSGRSSRQIEDVWEMWPLDYHKYLHSVCYHILPYIVFAIYYHLLPYIYTVFVTIHTGENLQQIMWGSFPGESIWFFHFFLPVISRKRSQRCCFQVLHINPYRIILWPPGVLRIWRELFEHTIFVHQNPMVNHHLKSFHS